MLLCFSSDCPCLCLFIGNVVLHLRFKPEAASLPSDWRDSLEDELHHKYRPRRAHPEVLEAITGQDRQSVDRPFKVVRGSNGHTSAAIVSGNPNFWETIFVSWTAEDELTGESMLKHFVNPGAYECPCPQVHAKKNLVDKKCFVVDMYGLPAEAE